MPFLTEPTEAECFEAEQELLFDVHFRQEKEELKKMFPVGSKNTEQLLKPILHTNKGANNGIYE
ncbi:MAG TPA: hypothetical protein PK505_07490 [Treponemataceae bacterium]|nr:hypothetical protein [Treponemataceae bacterium]